MKLLLASKSPRRRQLLSELGYEIKLVDVEVDEHSDLPQTPNIPLAEYLAIRKATAYTQPLAPDEVLVAADTLVYANGHLLGKPTDRNEARQMLHTLSGHSHEVFTGVCLRNKHQQHSFCETTKVSFFPLTDAEIDHYIDHYRPFDKAGSYGIQEWIGMIGVAGIEGCYYNVMGLPVARLYHELQHMQE